MPTPEASHSISKVLLKLGNAKTGVCVSLLLRVRNACSWASPQWNLSFFLVTAVNGAAMVLKSLTKR